MTNEKFTPGEWRAEIESHSFCDTGDYITEFGVVTGKNIGIAQCFDNSVINEEEAEANCHLIAAAPEMYKMLAITRQMFEDLADVLPNEQAKDLILDMASDIESVLEKARGEE